MKDVSKLPHRFYIVSRDDLSINGDSYGSDSRDIVEAMLDDILSDELDDGDDFVVIYGVEIPISITKTIELGEVE